jgi:hypothetical protein
VRCSEGKLVAVTSWPIRNVATAQHTQRNVTEARVCTGREIVGKPSCATCLIISSCDGNEVHGRAPRHKRCHPSHSVLPNHLKWHVGTTQPLTSHVQHTPLPTGTHNSTSSAATPSFLLTLDRRTRAHAQLVATI